MVSRLALAVGPLCANNFAVRRMTGKGQTEAIEARPRWSGSPPKADLARRYQFVRKVPKQKRDVLATRRMDNMTQ
jgi:hypothetical protein